MSTVIDDPHATLDKHRSASCGHGYRPRVRVYLCDSHVTAVTMFKLLCCCAAIAAAALRLSDRMIGAVAEAVSNPQRARRE